jgi:FkbM family methyltransferase
MVHIERWQSSRLNTALETLALPLVYLLNRRALAPVGRVAFEFALRCNGVGNNFDASSGLTRSEERFLRRRAASLAGATMLDVGANAGGYAAFVRGLASTAKIIAFEPHPRTFAHLVPRAAALGFEAVNQAVSDREGEATLFDFADRDGSTQASLDREVIALHGGGQAVGHQVRMTTLDAFAAARGIERISLLKIDTEGFDLAVLQGAAGLLRARRIEAIQFEFIASNIVRRISMKDFFEVLEGYSLHRLCLNGTLLPLGRYSPKYHEIYVRQNIVAMPAGAPA